MISASVAQLPFHVVAPTVVLTGRRCSAGVRAARLHGGGSGKSNYTDRCGPICRRSVSELAECVTSPAEHEPGGRSPTGVNGARRDSSENAGSFDEARL